MKSTDMKPADIQQKFDRLEIASYSQKHINESLSYKLDGFAQWALEIGRKQTQITNDMNELKDWRKNTDYQIKKIERRLQQMEEALLKRKKKTKNPLKIKNERK